MDDFSLQIDYESKLLKTALKKNWFPLFLFDWGSGAFVMQRVNSLKITETINQSVNAHEMYNSVNITK